MKTIRIFTAIALLSTVTAMSQIKTGSALENPGEWTATEIVNDFEEPTGEFNYNYYHIEEDSERKVLAQAWRDSKGRIALTVNFYKGNYEVKNYGDARLKIRNSEGESIWFPSYTPRYKNFAMFSRFNMNKKQYELFATEIEKGFTIFAEFNETKFLFEIPALDVKSVK